MPSVPLAAGAAYVTSETPVIAEYIPVGGKVSGRRQGWTYRGFKGGGECMHNVSMYQSMYQNEHKVNRNFVAFRLGSMVQMRLNLTGAFSHVESELV
jgi:hypothetical protein